MKEPGNEWAQALLDRMRRGDESALREMQQAYGRRIYAFALNRMHDESEADAVVTDTLWEVWKQPHRFHGGSKFSTWLLGIARYKMLNILRDRAPASDELDESMPSEDLGPFEERLAVERRIEVKRCMESLSVNHRECLQLAFFQELSIVEIAELQACPENTVKTRLFHARLNMKKCLEGRLS